MIRDAIGSSQLTSTNASHPGQGLVVCNISSQVAYDIEVKDIKISIHRTIAGYIKAQHTPSNQLLAEDKIAPSIRYK